VPAGFIDTRGIQVSDWAAATPQQRTLILRAELKLCGKNPDDVTQQEELATFFNSLENNNSQMSLDYEAQQHFGPQAPAPASSSAASPSPGPSGKLYAVTAARTRSRTPHRNGRASC
jgi:hypothetical protein